MNFLFGSGVPPLEAGNRQRRQVCKRILDQCRLIFLHGGDGIVLGLQSRTFGKQRRGLDWIPRIGIQAFLSRSGDLCAKIWDDLAYNLCIFRIGIRGQANEQFKLSKSLILEVVEIAVDHTKAASGHRVRSIVP